MSSFPYPGSLFSDDDWYQLSSGLVVLETTLSNWNTSATTSWVGDYQTLPTWIRVIVANRLAGVLDRTSGHLRPHRVSALDPASTTVQEPLHSPSHEGLRASRVWQWVELFAVHNSGTYSNQWMVVDLAAVSMERRRSLPEGALAGSFSGVFAVLEQAPGLVVAVDQSSVLNGAPPVDVIAGFDANASFHVELRPTRLSSNRNVGYWASYNRAFYSVLANYTDVPNAIRQYGAHFSWSDTARAVRFGALHSHAQSAATLGAVLRTNDYQTSTIGTQGCRGGARSGSNAIAARADLTLAGVGCIPDLQQTDEAAIDAKTTSLTLWQQAPAVQTTDGDGRNVRNYAISSPPYGASLQPFAFSRSPWAGRIPTRGLPDEWAFDWQHMALGSSTPTTSKRLR